MLLLGDQCHELYDDTSKFNNFKFSRMNISYQNNIFKNYRIITQLFIICTFLIFVFHLQAGSGVGPEKRAVVTQKDHPTLELGRGEKTDHQVRKIEMAYGLGKRVFMVVKCELWSAANDGYWLSRQIQVTRNLTFGLTWISRTGAFIQ